MSKAQLSEVNIYPSSNFPKHKGLIPCGSLIPISLSLVIITIAKEPLTADIASITALSIPFLAPLATKLVITSESTLVWKTCPPSSKRLLITFALTKLPL